MWSCYNCKNCIFIYSIALLQRRNDLPIRSFSAFVFIIVIWEVVQVMLRVSDLDKSIQYYTEALGLKLLRKKDNETGRYTLAFLAYNDEKDDTVFELTYNW